MANTDLRRSMKSYILRLYGTPAGDRWIWRFVLSPLNQEEAKEQGFESLQGLSDFLGVEIAQLENNDEKIS